MPHVPTCKEAGDILDHITRTHENVGEKWVKSKPDGMRAFRHYRLVLYEIGRDLLSFGSTKELVTAMRDAIIGMPYSSMFFTLSKFVLTAHYHTFRHYRLVLYKIGRDLLSFGSTKELVTAMRDAFIGMPYSSIFFTLSKFILTAHYHTYYDAGILHRDISAGNILITSSGQGLLIDWDLSKDTNSLFQRGLNVQ
jgi:hypothetical protein